MRWLIAALLCVSPLVSAKENEKPKKREKERERPAAPPSLELESADLVAARAWVRVGGASKPPDGRLFVFHDDRERHFVALYSRCEPAPSRKVDDDGEPRSDGNELRCELEMPRSYLRANVQSLTLRLHGKEVVADAEEVAARFAAARDRLGPGPAAAGWSGAALSPPAAAVAPPPPRSVVVDDPGFMPADELFPPPKTPEAQRAPVSPRPVPVPPPPAPTRERDAEESNDGPIDD